MISRWKKEFIERAPEIFKKGPSDADKALTISQAHIAELERKVGQLTYEVDWMKKKSTAILGPGWEKKKRWFYQYEYQHQQASQTVRY